MSGSAAAICAQMRGLRAPPPATMSCVTWARGETQRCNASTIDSAVRMVAVRTTSAGCARWRRPQARSFRR